VLIKSADADRYLARPDASVRVVLIYGSDEGLVAERTERMANAVVGPNADPLAHLRLESAEIAEDPPRLADEAHAIPLFGGTRAIRVRVAGNRPIDRAVQMILAAPPHDSWIILSAGDLRKSSPLRKLCETSKGAWSIASYADTDRDLDRMIDDETRNAGLTISAEARAALKSLIGSDRLISRSEIRKLGLYAAGSAGIGIADVRALVGDAGTFALDETVDAMIAGDSVALDRGYRRLVASGTPGIVVAGAALRHCNFLEKARAAIDKGETAEVIVRRAVPPIFPFSRQASVAKQISAWSAGRIERALTILDQAMLDSRLHGALADEIIGQAMQMVASFAAAPQQS
jgi:DNA polymerase-3 subunit delta